MSYLYKTIIEKETEYVVYGWSYYHKSSVLAGQSKKSFLGSYDSIEEAKLEHPKAELSHPIMEPQISLNHLRD